MERTTSRDGSMHALAVVVALVVCVLPLAVGLNRPPPNPDNMETILFQTCLETWRSGESLLLPTYEGEARVNKPPLAVWLNLAAWTGLDPATAGQATLVLRARLVSLALGLAMLGWIYWLGRSVASPRAGLIALAAAGTFPLFQAEARLCSYDVHFASWLTLAVAGAAAAVAGRATPRWTLVLLSGLALGLALMSKGPLALPLFLLPMVPLGVLTHQGRSTAMATAGALTVGLALAAPWYAWMLLSNAGAGEALATEYSGNLSAEHPWWFYPSRWLLGVAPWMLWLAAGLAAPLAIRTLRHDRAWMTPWLWMIAAMVLFTATPGKASRYLLPLVPPAALLVAAALERVGSEARAERPAWRAVAIAHCAGLAGGAVALPLVLSGRLLDPIPSSTYGDYSPLAQGVALGLAAVLTGIVAWGLYLRAWRSPAHIAAMSFAWAVATSTAMWMSAAAAAGEDAAPEGVTVPSADERPP